MKPARARQILAAPVLGDRGGGVGQVSQLLWRTLQDEWGSSAQVVTLLRNGDERPAAGDKWRFGLDIAGKRFFDRPEWILFSHLGLARVERYVPRRWEVPYAIFLHGIECWNPLPAEDVGILRRASLRIANSTFTARRAEAANPDLGEIAICPLALPEAPVISGRRSAPPTVLVVGRLSSTERYKGHEQLIRAWSGIKARVPDARLVIAGDGDDAWRLRIIASGLPAADSIEFTGFLPRPELERRYAEATLFALPSRGEGFGLVYLEAMAAGVACVGSIHDAASEVIVNGQTGILVDPDRLDAMGDEIAGLLSDAGRARTMGEAGRARWQSQFSYERFRARMTGLLNQAFAANGNGRGH